VTFRSRSVTTCKLANSEPIEAANIREKSGKLRPD
jgi:hypothetical protein